MIKKVTLLLLVFCLCLGGSNDTVAKETDRTEEVITFLKNMYDKRIQFLIDQDEAKIASFYLPEKYSRYAYKQELKRAAYINGWAEKRGIDFRKAEGSIRIGRVAVNGNRAKVFLVQSCKLTYAYKEPEAKEQWFGVGTRHALTLKYADGGWKVEKEWYLDPFDDVPHNIPTAHKPAAEPAEKFAAQLLQEKKSWRKKYNRQQAVAYADKYAGAAAGAGNNHRYNRKYKDYTYSGGDCTNFSSQVIGDPQEGGGLPMWGGWFYRNEGSTSWIRTDAFKDFLLYSGYGKLVMRGSYKQVTKRTDKYPSGAIAALEPGDLIGYEIRGDIDHFSIVTAKDDRGYVLVNSHSADRYHVPWDLGWDHHTKVWLIKIRD